MLLQKRVLIIVSFFSITPAYITYASAINTVSREKTNRQYHYDYTLIPKKRRPSVDNARQRGSGPSDATMRQSVLGGGYLSGGHMSYSMGAGATRGHGHR